MVMESIQDHFIVQFSEMIHTKAQQTKARLRPYVEIQQVNGKAAFYDGIGPVEAQELFGRHNDSTPSDIEHYRRQIPLREFGLTLWSDRTDIENRLTDPRGKYAEAMMWAIERRFDRTVIESALADVRTGETGAGTVTFTGGGGLTVTATGGIDETDLLAMHQNFIDAEIGIDSGRRIAFPITGDEHTALLGRTAITSGDFSRQYVLEQGELVRAIGIDLIKFGAAVANPMLSVSGGVRTSFALAEGGIAVGMAREMDLTVKDRADKYNVTQLQITARMGAVRTEEKRVQKVTTTD